MTKFFICVMHLKQIEPSLNLVFPLFYLLFQPFKTNSSVAEVRD